MPTPVLLPALTLLSAALAIFAAPLGAPALAFLCKPLTTILIIAWAWPRGADEPRVRHWLLIGLGLSLLGDIALLWPKEGFLAGLVAFLLAHLSYIVAFTLRARFAGRPMVFALYGIVTLAILTQLWPGVPDALRVPVVAYVICLASMAAQAAVAWRMRGDSLTLAGALGGALFVASDATLATSKFLIPVPMATLAILATYWAAQWCIASSLAPRPVPQGHMPLNRPV